MITGPDLDRHTLRFLGRTWHETDFSTYYVFCILQTIQRPDQSEEYDQLWKLRIGFDTLSDNYAKFYNPSENLAVEKVIVKYRDRVNFRQYIPKKRKCFGITIYKLCDEAGYTCAMKVYLDKDSQSATDDTTATHATVRNLTSRDEGLGHKLFLVNFFSSPRLFEDLDRHKINSCRTVRLNKKDMPLTLHLNNWNW